MLNDAERFIEEKKKDAEISRDVEGGELRAVRIRGKDAFRVYEEINKILDRTMELVKVDIPGHWQDPDSIEEENFKVFQLAPDSDEFASIRDTIVSEKYVRGATIVKVERVQNFRHFRRYEIEKQRMLQKYKSAGVPEPKQLERVLYHSTGIDPLKVLQSEEGLDLKFSERSLHGQGNYFATCLEYNFRSSIIHKVKDTSPQQFKIVLCHVLVGYYHTKECLNSEEKAIVPLDEGKLKGTGLTYDSVTDTLDKSSDRRWMFVTFANCKAYGEYVVTFTK